MTVGPGSLQDNVQGATRPGSLPGHTKIAVCNDDGSDISASGGGGGTPIPPGTTPTIYNVSMATANTEYSQVLGTNVKRFSIKLRDFQDLKLAYVSGTSGTIFISVPAASEYHEENLKVTSLTLYFQSDAAGQVAEIVEWT